MLTARQLASLRSSVADRVVARAQRYIPHAVQILAGSATSVDAVVTGSQSYETHLDAGADGRVSGSCTCPYFEDRLDPCKHIWAALMVAIGAGHLGVLNGAPDPVIVGLDEALDDPIAEAGDEVELGPWAPPVRPTPTRRGQRPHLQPARRPPWQAHLEQARTLLRQDADLRRRQWPADADVRLVLEDPIRGLPPRCVLRAIVRVPRRKGGWTKPKPTPIFGSDIASLPLPDDIRTLVARIVGGQQAYLYGGYAPSADGCVLSDVLAADVLPGLCAAGRVVLPGEGEPQALSWDDGPAWRFVVGVDAAVNGTHKVAARIERGRERLPIDAVVLYGAVVRQQATLARLDAAGAGAWLQHFASTPSYEVPAIALDDWLAGLAGLPLLPPLAVAPEVEIRIEEGVPLPMLAVAAPRAAHALQAKLAFAYGDVHVLEGPGAGVFDPATRTLTVRDRASEARYTNRLDTLGVRSEPAWPVNPAGPARLLNPTALRGVLRVLAEEGWVVSANGARQRGLSRVDASLRSGIDWFDLEGAAYFGDVALPLPELLAALERGAETVALPDGSDGVISNDIARTWRMVARLGRSARGALRLTTAEALLLDRLVDPEQLARADEGLQALRARVATYGGTADIHEPDTFVGELRPYQRDGLRWLAALRDLGLGGCLADDMGLGKTVMVLAWLEHLRREGAGRPSLVVVPRSLVFNWLEEARRFTPALRVLDLSHALRASEYAKVPDADLAISTYGTLRRDVSALADQTFEYAILDEAQAIKNAATASAKAARALRARHHLTLTGTPIENRLTDLWSILDFANPAMAARGGLGRLAAGASAADERERLARAVRPLVLRRTKAQVARDLPPRTEQTISCELGASERRLYDELREHYRAALLSAGMRLGTGRGRMHVLEALLRLRQAACHPGLIDPLRRAESSAKLDQLAAQVGQVLSEGSKALVFSQFTSMLALVRARFDAEGWTYEYLDGQTKDRQARVDRFQSDAACPVFLISLKAGGVGLNLTAAEYVFLLDPWWNPAVEAQAVDRTHRIGQTRPVFAYRLVARDTVEEKVLELQQRKRELAEAIVRADEGPLTALTREDLEMLLS